MTDHQPREHSVRCQVCMDAMTWNLDAICDRCRARRAIANLEIAMDELVGPDEDEAFDRHVDASLAAGRDWRFNDYY